MQQHQNKAWQRITTMTLLNILHMNSGDGESSYANNSSLQERAIQKSLPYLKDTIKGMASHDVFNNCFMIADLGCSLGTNTLLVASNIIDAVHEVCEESSRNPPQFAIFKLLPDFYSKFKKDSRENFGPCFVSAIPGSFYCRLVPDESLHLVHSSYSIHWLSQIPEGIEKNELNIYMAKNSPPNVFQAYGKQFHTDFTKFLQLRCEEIVRGGCVVLILPGRSTVDPTSDDCCSLCELLALSLLDMSKEGLVRETDIYSFNIPIYSPCQDELKNIIQCEGSFSLENMNVFPLNWDPHDTDYTNLNDANEASQIHGKKTAKCVRAVTEPLLTSHFGNFIIDRVFTKFEKRVARHLSYKKTRLFNMAVSLTKK